MSCTPSDVISSLEERKQVLLNNLTKGSQGFLDSGLLVGSLSDFVTNTAAQVLSDVTSGIINNVFDELDADELTQTVGSLLVFLSTLGEHSRLFYFGMYVESLKQTVANRIKVSRQIDRNIKNIISFINEWEYKASTKQWDRMNEVYPHISKAEQSFRLAKEELNNTGRILVSNFKRSQKEIERAESIYINNQSYNINNISEEARDQIQNAWKDQVDNFMIFLNSISEIIQIFPIAATILNKYIPGMNQVLSYIVGGASIAGVSTIVNGKSIEQVAAELAEDALDLTVSYLSGQTLVSANTMIRADVDELRNFDLNYNDLLIKNKAHLKAIIKSVYDDLKDIKDSMKADLDSSKTANVKLASKNTIYSTKITLLKNMFEGVDDVIFGYADIQELYESLEDIQRVLNNYPEVHYLEQVVADFPSSMITMVESLWDTYGPKRSIIELNNIRRYLQNGIAMDVELYNYCENFDVVEIPLIGMIKGSASYLEKKGIIENQKSKFESIIGNVKTFFSNNTNLAVLNITTNLISLEELKDVFKYDKLSLSGTEACADSLQVPWVSEGSTSDAYKEFKKSKVKLEAALNADMERLEKGYETVKKWFGDASDKFSFKYFKEDNMRFM